MKIHRTRRLRRSSGLRQLVQENHLRATDLVYPVFLRHGQNTRNEIPSMPGCYQLSVDQLDREAEELGQLGVPAVILFGIPAEKDPVGEENFAEDGIVQRGIRRLKKAHPELVVVTDVCLCEYTDHGHCGLINHGNPLPHPELPEGAILNDETLDILGKVALSHAEAGADMVAPSGMMDGMVHAIRTALDQRGHQHVPILSYAVKYASAYYGPFRDAAESPPQFGDRRSHQMNPANARVALREAAIDIEEGADILMVKPALPYLDVLGKLSERFPEIPLAAYQVSGEYAMLKAAGQNGWLDERAAALESLIAIKRAGASFILTYYAKEAAHWLAEGSHLKNSQS
ncbi:MAG: porphobilinogen synthase [Anaerolineales bacterium]